MRIKPNLLTVAVCTYNREEFLPGLLESVLRQMDADLAGCVKLLVIDNNSTDGTSVLLESYKARGVDHLLEERQGLSQARNCALKHVQTLYLAYLDDDAYVCEGWLRSVVDMCLDGLFDCFGGLYLPWYRDGRLPWFLDCWASNEHIDGVTRELEPHLFLSGGNVCFNVGSLRHVGEFNDRIGMTGKKIAYGEEILVQRRMRSSGMKLGYNADMQIMHFTSLEKQTLRWQIKRCWAAGRDLWEAAETKPTLLQRLRQLCKAILFPLLRMLVIGKNPKVLAHPKRFFLFMFGPSITSLSAMKARISDV